MTQCIAKAQGFWYADAQAWLRRIQGQPMILPFAFIGESLGA